MKINEADLKWSWWSGWSDEQYDTRCNSREEAVERAKYEYPDGGYVVEAAEYPPLRLSNEFRVEWFIDHAENNAYDSYASSDDCDAFFEMSGEQEKDLEACVRKAIDEWQDRHKLKFTARRFYATRNEEYVGPEEEESDD